MVHPDCIQSSELLEFVHFRLQPGDSTARLRHRPTQSAFKQHAGRAPLFVRGWPHLESPSAAWTAQVRTTGRATPPTSRSPLPRSHGVGRTDEWRLRGAQRVWVLIPELPVISLSLCFARRCRPDTEHSRACQLLSRQ